MSEPEEFQCIQDGLAVFPYHPKAGAFKEDALIRLYERLKTEELFDIVFHENPGLTALEFLNFFNQPRNLLLIFGVVDGDQFDTAGLAWLSDVTLCSDQLTRATGSFVYFKQYQRAPYTDAFGKRALEYWFKYLHINTLVGLTPESNRAALIYIKRLGLKECGRVPQFTTLFGKVTDAVVTVMTAVEYEEWNAKEV